MKKILKVQTNYPDTRIDKWLKKNFNLLNQSFIEKNLRKGNIKVNNKKVSAKYKLLPDDEISIFNFSEKIYNQISTNINKKIIPKNYLKLFKESIIFENENFIILDKWSGIATQGGSKINISIDDIIKSLQKDYNLVHRLDRETSGLLIIAKNIYFTRLFGGLFKNRLINKIYLATCQGKPKNLESEVNFKILDKKNASKTYDTITNYKVLQTKDNLSNILFSPKTGKTHQIRIVSKYLGCPIIGDTKYNKEKKYNFEKLKLNAHYLQFEIKEKKYKFISKLPKHFLDFFNKNKLNLVKNNQLKIF